MKKHIILFLAANPRGTGRRALDEELRAIQVELERSGFRHSFELVARWAVRPLDLLHELRNLKPTVVHYSGHGGQNVAGERRSGQSPHREIIGGPSQNGDEQEHGLFFQRADGSAQLVTTAALKETFGAAGASVKLVVLNACYSEVQAEALRAHVDCVVGMGGSIHDDAARSFAIGFYGGLGERESVAAAYKQGCAAISLEGLADRDRPQLKLRDGIDASQLVLAADPSREDDQKTPPGDPAAEWLRFGVSRHDRVMVIGFRETSIPLRLDDVFVPLYVFADRARKGGGPDPRADQEGGDHGGAEISLDSALDRASSGQTRLALIGDPGAGKTTLLRYLFCRIALNDDVADSIARLHGLYPVLIRLATVTDAEQVARGLSKILERICADDGYPKAGPALLVRPGQRFLFLLDGLDEVRDEPARERICAWLNQEIDHWPGCGFIVTSRRAAWARTAALGARFLPVSVQGMRGDTIERYVGRWFRAVMHHFQGAVDPVEEIEARAIKQAEALLAVLATPSWRSSPRLLEMTANPLMLSTLCLTYYSDSRLPDRRGDLYERTLKILFEAWGRERSGGPTLHFETTRLVLQPLAYVMHEQDRSELAVREAAALVRKPLSRVPALHAVTPTPERFLDLVRDECGLLKNLDLDRIEFVHLSFQEYLAACHISERDLGRALADRANDSRWEEVILLAMSRPRVFERFMARAQECGDIDAALLSRCRREREGSLQPSVPERHRSISPIIGHLVSVAMIAVLMLASERRALAVDVGGPVREVEEGTSWLGWVVLVAGLALFVAALARFREGLVGWWLEVRSRTPREGHGFVEPATDMRFVWIPGGRFLMGSSKEPGQPNYDSDANHDEAPTHEEQITDFWMSIYPVTNEQYRRFISETGHTAPWSFSDRRFNASEQPVVTVSWDDARAFTAWLTAKLVNTEVRLPTEAEWEYAARGTDGRRYPWGNEPPDASRATFGQAWETGRPAVVGYTPGGKSPFNVHDMAGNVLEWCMDTRTDAPDERGKARAVRGGSWLLPGSAARCAGRGSFELDDQGTTDLGFRVMCRLRQRR